MATHSSTLAWRIRTSLRSKSSVTYSWSDFRRERESCSVMSDSFRPHGIVHGVLQARILERVATPFSRGSSQPRDQTQVSRIAGGFFTSWATRDVKSSSYPSDENSMLKSVGLFHGSFPSARKKWNCLPSYNLTRMSCLYPARGSSPRRPLRTLNTWEALTHSTKKKRWEGKAREQKGAKPKPKPTGSILNDLLNQNRFPVRRAPHSRFTTLVGSNQLSHITSAGNKGRQKSNDISFGLNF